MAVVQCLTPSLLGIGLIPRQVQEISQSGSHFWPVEWRSGCTVEKQRSFILLTLPAGPQVYRGGPRVGLSCSRLGGLLISKVWMARLGRWLSWVCLPVLGAHMWPGKGGTCPSAPGQT